MNDQVINKTVSDGNTNMIMSERCELAFIMNHRHITV